MSSRYNKLSDAEKTWLQQTLFNQDYTIVRRIEQVMERFSVTKRTVWTWRKNLKADMQQVLSANPVLQAAASREITNNGYYMFTWAQNATPVHGPFWENLKAYCEFLDAEIHVIPGMYRNPSLFHNRKESNEWWDGEVEDYLNTNRTEVHPQVLFVGDIKTQPTAQNPMRGFEGIAGERTAIFGHPKVQLQTMPSLPGHHGAIHMTTGACTVRNYSDTKAGKRGEHHHVFGFVMLECVADKVFHIRQVTANADGSFTDLFFNVDRGEVTDIKSSKGFVMGDIHARKLERGVLDSTVGYFDRVRPDSLILHDVFDGESVNHHAEKDPFQAHKLYQEERNTLSDEVTEVVDLVEELLPYNPVLVYSNHCEWIDRWLMRVDWKKDMANAATYLHYAQIMLTEQPEKGFLHYHLDDIFGDKITTLGPNDSHKVGAWETATHGHLGINGARGSMTGFRKFNTKVIFGHLHSAARYDGAVQVGTYTSMDMGYNRGPSSWAHCGAVIHNDDRVQQIFFTEEDGEYKYTTLHDVTTTVNV